MAKLRLGKVKKKNLNFEGENKKNIEFSPEALQLIEALGKENWKVRDFLINSYKGLQVTPEMEEAFYNYFISHSIFSAATAANPATSVITELLYEGEEKLNLISPIDQYFLRSKAGKSIKARLRVVEEELYKTIEEYRQKREVLIGSFGSGPGRDVIDVFSTYYRDTLDVRAVLIDKDKLALQRGKRMAIINKVDHLIEFVEGNFLKYKPLQKFDIVLLIGVLCPLDFKTCIVILKKIRSLLKKDGCLIASNVSKKMLKEDPFTCHLMNLGNWKMVFKDEEEFKKIFKKAGYRWKKCVTDSYGFHIIGLGIPNLTFTLKI